VNRKYTVWVIAGFCTFPLGAAAYAHLATPAPLYQNPILPILGITSPFVVIACIACSFVARMDYWHDFPIWRMLAWQFLCVGAAILLLMSG
jgi:hypothetical protein